MTKKIEDLKKEIEYYKNLISKAENVPKKEFCVQKSITMHASGSPYKNSQTVYKSTKNSIRTQPYFTTKLISNTPNKFVRNQKLKNLNRNAMYNQNLNSNHSFRNKMSMNNNYKKFSLTACKGLYSEAFVKAPVVSAGSSTEMSNNCQELIKQITDFTQHIKETSGCNSKFFMSSKKHEVSKQNFNNSLCPKKLNAKTEHFTLNKETNKKVPSLNMSNNLNSPVSIYNPKQNVTCGIPFKCNEAQRKTRFQSRKSFISDEKHRKNKIVGNMKFDRTVNTPLRVLNKSHAVSQNVLPSSELLPKELSDIKDVSKMTVSHSFNVTGTPRSKFLSSNKKRLVCKKLGVAKEPNASKSVINKSLNIYKMNFKPIHTKINTRYSLTSNKINKYVLNRTASNVQILADRKSRNMKSKYKIVNKTLTPLINKRKRKLQVHIDPGFKENSLPLDKSDPLFEVLQSSAANDKLEQELLSKNCLTVLSEPVSKSLLPSIKLSANKINSKYKFKKTPVKKYKVLTKYKVVNKNSRTSKSYATPVKRVSPVLKHNTVRKTRVKLSKFSIVNKHSPYLTPCLNRKSILVKRIFKSKSTIINKNVSPVNQSAKSIKSKYLALNRRKLPRSPTFISPKAYFRKGCYVSSNLHLKQSKYQKFGVSTLYRPKRNRFLGHKKTAFSTHHAKNSKGRSLKKKLNHAYSKSPVVVIRGVRYSLNSSGKTLRKLPNKSQLQSSKTPKKILVGGRSFIRISENMMKASTPVSANLASRVLHRSINTVLTASTKKNTTKVNTYCMFYNRFGRCNRGVKCTYVHDPSKIAVCTRFLRGTCKVDGCPFSHEVAPGKMAICSFFLVGACEKDNCPYRHENLSPDAVLCKAFVQGYCPNGKECKKAHILICPKFIQGTCEKGSSCAFPHPSPKVKKNVQNDEMADIDEKKTGEVLLEKVARYFQSANEDSALLCKAIMNENDTVKLCVPRQRRLEEQPSFIPLSSTSVISRSKKLETCSLKSLQDAV